MKLYVYDHCPFCVRARLAFSLKGIPFDLGIIMEGDVETPTRMIGKKMVPILQKPDGSYMGESLDIVAYLDQTGTPMFSGPASAELDAWAESSWKTAVKLVIPRFTKGDFAELATPEAREAFRLREVKSFGDLDELMANTATYATETNTNLAALNTLLEGRTTYGISDIKLWPLLRSLSIVKDLTFPTHVRRYMDDLSTRGNVPLLFNQAV